MGPISPIRPIGNDLPPLTTHPQAPNPLFAMNFLRILKAIRTTSRGPHGRSSDSLARGHVPPPAPLPGGRPACPIPSGPARAVGPALLLGGPPPSDRYRRPRRVPIRHPTPRGPVSRRDRGVVAGRRR